MRGNKEEEGAMEERELHSERTVIQEAAMGTD